MSDTSESPIESPPSPPKAQLHTNPDFMSDVVLWRRKQLNVIILLAATATWTVMDVYQFNFITLACWVVMAIVACLFFWGNIHRLLKKEAPDLSELEVSEETAMEQANSFRQGAEEVIKLIFHLSSEREWFVFVGIVALLYVISVVAKYFHFVTLLYIGVIGAMTIPIIYVKNEHKMNELGERVRMRSQKLYSMIKDKFQNVKNKIGGQRKEIKEKKQE